MVNTRTTAEPDRKARRVAGANTLAADPVEKPYLKWPRMASGTLRGAAGLNDTGRLTGRIDMRRGLMRRRLVSWSLAGAACLAAWSVVAASDGGRSSIKAADLKEWLT